MRRKVRLLSDAYVAGHEWLLEHIDVLLLKRLIEVDDALVGEQKGEKHCQISRRP